MNEYLRDVDCTLYHGDVLDVLRGMDADSVDCVVTSPPYWGLRDYGTGAWEGGDEGCDHVVYGGGPPESSSLDGAKQRGRSDVTADPCRKCGARRVDNQLGLEPTPDQYVQRMVSVFREVRRVLAPHGTCWVNLGDSYASSPPGNVRGVGETSGLAGADSDKYRATLMAGHATKRNTVVGDLKPKDLVGIPWRVAFALQADGWWLRSDIVWAKSNPMPESVTDRPTKAHEYVFLLTKQPRYWFDQEAVREPADWARWGDQTTPKHADSDNGAWMKPKGKAELEAKAAQGRNVRSVWTIATQPYPEAHFATYPEELVRRCVLAGCPERVCRTCGKASERLTSTEYDNPGNRRTNGPKSAAAQGDPYLGTVGSRGVRLEKRVTTEGWSDCGHNDWRPGLVLDPFVGSGTTCLVARNHGRHSVGIDLNADYLALAATRLQQLSLLAGEAHASQ